MRTSINSLSLICLLVFSINTNICSAQGANSGNLSTNGIKTDLTTSVPRTMTYQANLRDINGNPAPGGDYSVIFRIYDALAGGTILWEETVIVTTSQGSFTAVLGETIPINLSFDADYYLSLQVEGDDEMEPRQKLHMNPYAAVADTSDHAFTIADDAVTSPSILDGSVLFADIGQNGATTGQVMKWNGSAWVADADETGPGGGGGWADDGNYVRLDTGTDSVGIGTATPSEKLEVSGNILITGKATIGPNNTNTGSFAFVAGINNMAGADYATVSGGYADTASGYSATVGGGVGNTASGNGSVVGGGHWNTALGERATIGGGLADTASGNYSTVGGGYINTASNAYGTVSGGQNNTANSTSATVAGGSRNFVDGLYSAILGGYADTITATGDYSYLFGIRSKLTQDSTFMVDMPHIRFGDEASGFEFPTLDGTNGQIMATDGSGLLSWTDVSGGGGGWADDGNYVRLDTGTDSVGIGTATPSEKLEVDGNILVTGKATIGPGNTNTGSYAFAAGQNNTAGGDYATVGGGRFNYARGDYSVVAGGGGANAPDSNSASGAYSAISGGMRNTASTNFTIVGGGYNNTAAGYVNTIAGGYNNNTNGDYSGIGGGVNNTASGDDSWVGGGVGNTANGGYAPTISGGSQNTATNTLSTVGGGRFNDATGSESTIAGGFTNIASNASTSVGGGSYNTASGEFSTVAGGEHNEAIGNDSFLGGGTSNLAENYLTTVGGGGYNIAGNTASMVGGGKYNYARGNYSVVAGGGGASIADSNSASGNHASILGGTQNKATGEQAAIGGGYRNVASALRATIGGGGLNTANGSNSTIAGGFDNTVSASSVATIGGGYRNIASGNYSTIPGGYYNTAAGVYSFAAGNRAKANHDGSFVWADSYNADFTSSTTNQFNVRAIGGTRVYSNGGLTAGVILPAGASAWSGVSDSTLKRNIRRVNGEEILERLAQLPISRWSYKAQDESIEHIGPMAQDFFALFGLGEDDKRISTIDPSGVALAAIQELHKQNNTLISDNDTLREIISRLETRITRLEENIQ